MVRDLQKLIQNEVLLLLRQVEVIGLLLILGIKTKGQIVIVEIVSPGQPRRTKKDTRTGKGEYPNVFLYRRRATYYRGYSTPPTFCARKVEQPFWVARSTGGIIIQLMLGPGMSYLLV